MKKYNVQSNKFTKYNDHENVTKHVFFVSLHRIRFHPNNYLIFSRKKHGGIEKKNISIDFSSDFFRPLTFGIIMKEEMKTISMSDINEPSETTALRQKLESIDDMLPHVGNFGRYQWYLLLALLPYSIAYSNLYFSQFFLTLVPQEHWCYVDALQDINMTQEERSVDLFHNHKLTLAN